MLPRNQRSSLTGFLAWGLDRFIGEEDRLSYVLWEEENIPPTLVLEVVSKTYGGEYERKKEVYADLGIRYYAIYTPNQSSIRTRRQRQPLEVYALIDNTYQRLEADPVWLPEIGLSLGRGRGTYLGREREWLYWYNSSGQRLLTPEEKAKKLANKLKELGIDPDSIWHLQSEKLPRTVSRLRSPKENSAKCLHLN